MRFDDVTLVRHWGYDRTKYISASESGHAKCFAIVSSMHYHNLCPGLCLQHHLAQHHLIRASDTRPAAFRAVLNVDDQGFDFGAAPTTFSFRLSS